MNLSHLSDEQIHAVRTGAIDWTGWALCGTRVRRHDGTCRCDGCQMPVKLDENGRWIYA